MRKISRITLVAAMAMALFAAMGSPAHATTVGGGAVGGTVKITNEGCIPVATATPKPVTYTFSDVVIPGAFAHSSGATFVGQIDVSNVKGNSVAPHDNTIAGQGVVNTALDQAVFNGNNGVTAITGNFYGKYQRIGSIVLVDLKVTARIVGGPSEQVPVTVAAHFQPVSGDGFVAPVCEAAFGGVYTTADNPVIS